MRVKQAAHDCLPFSLFAVGVPLITALYENNPNIGMYTLPLIIWYPMQVVVGTVLVPRLQAFIRNETARLAGTEADESLDDEDDDVEFAEGYGDDLERGQLPVEGEGMEVDSCVAMPWAKSALVEGQDSELMEDEVVDVSLAELDTASVGSQGEVETSKDES